MPEAVSESLLVADYDLRWPALYAGERERIAGAIGEWIADVQHVGSTAVPGLAAKPVIDTMAGLRPWDDRERCIAPLEALGYENRGENALPGALIFVKLTDDPLSGQTYRGSDGRTRSRTHNLHLLPLSHPEWERHILFRDYLRNHPSVARGYADLKRRCAATFGLDINAYTEAKTDFVEECIARASAEPTYMVEIADYDPRWPGMFEDEKNRIRDSIDEWLVDVEHIGSTSVPGLAAKPIIDMMPTLRDLTDATRCIRPMEALGYEYVPQYEVFLPERRYFQKGYPRTHHVHMVEVGSAFARRHIAFRDYLRSHPEAAAEYAALKRTLAQEHRTDRFAYTDAKSQFILGIEETGAAAPGPSSPAAERGAPATR